MLLCAVQAYLGDETCQLTTVAFILWSSDRVDMACMEKLDYGRLPRWLCFPGLDSVDPNIVKAKVIGTEDSLKLE